ncbi:dispanin subfamily A member 2b isoform X1 [Anolis carolinensis]|uniref:dispanin subfamily A member 2b isoform X1 n=1 Tax=Anolis carolinensis TaxID=28377 RepID=UPI0007DB85D0|nr:PREDICTED: dispanin subfamily A member 2b [Anolis carolinensis]|eukprot:XP_016849182.1 PREDICTED: dispanin subfamily A member 2b [Anolis carolinensis]
MHAQAHGMQPVEGKGPGGVDAPGPRYPHARATLVSLRRMPRDYLVWSLFTFFYGNFCCLGLAALVFSIKSRDAKVLGDVESAEEHGKTDRCLSVVALALAIVSMIVSIIVMATSMAYIYNRFQDVNRPPVYVSIQIHFRLHTFGQ